MQHKRLMSVVLLRNLFEAHGWQCKTRGDTELYFTKDGEDSVFVSTDSCNKSHVNIYPLLNSISSNMRAVISSVADSISFGIDLCINPGSADREDISNLLNAVFELNIALGGDTIYPELIPCDNSGQAAAVKEMV